MELLALVKKQAGIPMLLEGSPLGLAEIERVREFIPSAEELKELEKRFYDEGAEYLV